MEVSLIILINFFVGMTVAVGLKIVISNMIIFSEVLAEALYWSVDPYMRVYVRAYNHPLGTAMMGGQVSRYCQFQVFNFTKLCMALCLLRKKNSSAIFSSLFIQKMTSTGYGEKKFFF